MKKLVFIKVIAVLSLLSLACASTPMYPPPYIETQGKKGLEEKVVSTTTHKVNGVVVDEQTTTTETTMNQKMAEYKMKSRIIDGINAAQESATLAAAFAANGSGDYGYYDGVGYVSSRDASGQTNYVFGPPDPNLGRGVSQSNETAAILANKANDQGLTFSNAQKPRQK